MRRAPATHRRAARTTSPTQLTLDSARKPTGRGGWRPNAGRPRGRHTCSHDARKRFTSRVPVHITLRIAKDVPNLRRSEPVTIIREAIAASHTDSFRILEYTVLGNHLHLLVEADSQAALASAMRTLGVRLAKRLNRCFARRGALLAERYHARRLHTPREVRNVLRYLLLNARHHAAERGQRLARGWIDPASSAAWFDGWQHPHHLDRTAYWIAQLLRHPRPTQPPRTWLCTLGWRRHGLLSIDDIPGPTPKQAVPCSTTASSRPSGCVPAHQRST